MSEASWCVMTEELVNIKLLVLQHAERLKTRDFLNSSS